MNNNNNPSEQKSTSKLRVFLNIHVLFALIIIGIIAIIFFRITNWGEKVDLDQISQYQTGTYDNSFDFFLPVMDENGQIVETDTEAPVIVAFGNAPFADDRDSEDNLCNLIAEATGGTVYNCSVSGSYLAAQGYAFNPDTTPMDAYCFYWLITRAVDDSIDFFYKEAEASLGEDVPPEAKEVYETITTIDWNEVDVITVMYDASDYLMGHNMYNDSNATDTTQFTGNLEAGIELMRSHYPHIRFIVMSPAYAYAVDENGNYISSSKYIYNDKDYLFTYVVKQAESCQHQSVSFIDHLYGTITADNADKYLIDNLHINAEGRKLIADRFEYCLNYYSKGYGHSDN